MGRRKKMQIRTITVDYARPRGYDVGYRAENNFTLLALPVPEELEGADSYRVYFESTVGEYLQTELLTPTDGYVTVKITSDIVPEPGNMAAQLVAFADGEIVGKAPMITGTAKVSIPDGTERLSHSLAAEIALNTAARHSHANKSVLDKFAETDGKPTYDGKAIGSGGTGGASTAEDVSYTNTQLPDVENVKTALDELVPDSHTHDNKSTLDKLSDSNGKLQYNGSDVGLKGDKGDPGAAGAKGDPGEKGDTGAKGADGKDGTNGITPTIGANGNWYLGATDTGEPSRGEKGDTGASGAPGKDGTNGSPGADGVTPHIGENGNWYIGSTDTGKPSRGDKGEPGSDANVTKANVVTALGYTPKAVSAQVATGTNITLADNTEYRLADVTTLTLTYPTGKFECWMRLTFAASGNITVTLPADTEYLGATPNFKNGETWELSFKDKVLAAKKVGDDDKDAGGENGITPHIGDNGNWYIGNTDTGKPSRGEKGDPGAKGDPGVPGKDGADGKQGAAGTDGITPHIGDNGNWYIGSTDTGKPSRGEKGDKGDTGATGADGKTPVKGTDYWTVADKQEIVNDVIAALPDGTEVSY